MIRVLIADDNQLMRNGLSLLLARTGDIQVVGQARDGKETVALAKELCPDVILMDIRMPGVSGLDAVREIRRENGKVPILILAMAYDAPLVHRAFESGASGFIAKHEFVVDLVPGVRAVHAGQKYQSPSVVEELALHGDPVEYGEVRFDRMPS